jgi:SNF2 family DNA or RNA helicase
VGSSNFTVHGLGIGKGADKNIELNMIIDNDRDREALLKWFNEIWNDSTGLVEDVKEKVLRFLEQFYAENSPEFIYYKTLYHIFSAWLTEQNEGKFFNEKTSLYESEIWNCLYDFQKDGVKGAIHKILKYSGCIIADSVGLGKTYEALAIIKYFESQNARVLVICPKKLSKNWTVYQSSQNQETNPFKKDRFNYTVLYHTDMGRTFGKSSANNVDLANFDWNAYDLVVIDESHNFRGNAEIKTKNGISVMNRSSWLMEKVKDHRHSRWLEEAPLKGAKNSSPLQNLEKPALLSPTFPGSVCTPEFVPHPIQQYLHSNPGSRSFYS